MSLSSGSVAFLSIALVACVSHPGLQGQRDVGRVGRLAEGMPETKAEFLACFESSEVEVRRAAASLSGDLHLWEARNCLEMAVGDSDSAVKEAATVSLFQLAEVCPDGKETWILRVLLIPGLDMHGIRRAAAKSLLRNGGWSGMLMEDGDWWIRSESGVAAVREYGAHRSEVLRMLSSEADREVLLHVTAFMALNWRECGIPGDDALLAAGTLVALAGEHDGWISEVARGNLDGIVGLPTDLETARASVEALQPIADGALLGAAKATMLRLDRVARR